MKTSSTLLFDVFREKPEIGKYMRYLATVVNSIGSPDFEERFVAFLSRLVPIDHCCIFTYSDKGKAGHLFTNSRMQSRDAEKLARDYVEKFHQQDPNFDYIKAMKNKKYYQFEHRDISNDYDPAYQNHFFDRTGLIDKTSCIGQIENGNVYCNFYRMNDSNVYTASELKILDDLMPLATALVASHFEMCRSRGLVQMDNGSENIVTKSIVHNVLSNNLEVFSKLTLRERQVCERIMLGYTAIGMGLDLDIAPTSVATYRKRAYKKLSIGSQNELFALCLRLIKR